MAPQAVRDIEPVAGLRSPTETPVITWVDDTAAAGPGGQSQLYLVDVSTDGGKLWQTIGVNLTSPEVSIDRSMLVGAKEVFVHVTATDGFDERITTKRMNASDL